MQAKAEFPICLPWVTSPEQIALGSHAELASLVVPGMTMLTFT